MKKIIIFLMTFVILVTQCYADSSVPHMVVVDDYEVSPTFVLETFTAAAFMEFVVGLGLSVGLTGLAIDVIRNDNPVESFEELESRGVDFNLVSALKDKYNEMVEFYSKGLGTVFKLGSAWLSSLDFGSLASALGYKQVVKTGSTLDILSLPFVKDKDFKYYIVTASGFPDGSTFSYVSFRFFNDYEVRTEYKVERVFAPSGYYHMTINFDRYNVDDFTSSDLIYANGSSYMIGRNYTPTTTYPYLYYATNTGLDVGNAIFSDTLNGFITGDIYNNDVSEIDEGVITPNFTDDVGVTAGAITNYPIPKPNDNITGNTIIGKVDSVVPGIQDYVDNAVISGDLVIDNVVDVPEVDVPEIDFSWWSWLKDWVMSFFDTLANLLKALFIPQADFFKDNFNALKDKFANKLGFDSYLSFFDSLKGLSSLTPDFKGYININIWNKHIGSIQTLIKGFFYVFIFIFNIKMIMWTIRKSSPVNSGGASS